MAKILTFRSKDGTTSTQGFLQEGDDTLSFQVTPEGRVDLGEMVVPPLPDQERTKIRDWGNQEMADLFRVKRLLDAAGIPNEIDRGLTDEGDPWFVFCGMDGEVFIHLCRIDGLYVLDSPNIETPLRGVDFNALIADFTNRPVPRKEADAEGTLERRIIRLERGGKVRLHPSALLAALIWTLFLASEELVLMAPNEDDETIGLTGLDPQAEGGNDDWVDDIPMITSETLSNDVFDAETVRDAARNGTYAAEADLVLRELQGQQGLALNQNGYALGLSTIAIAIGIMSETVFVDDRNKILDGLRAFDLAALDAAAAEGIEEQAQELNPVAALLDEISVFLESFMQTRIAEADPSGEMESNLPEDALAFFNMLKFKPEYDLAALEHVEANAAHVPEKLQAALDDTFAIPEISDDVVSLQPLPVEETTPAPVNTAFSISNLTLTGIMQAWQPALDEFMLGETRVMASFDVTDETYVDNGIVDFVTDPATIPVKPPSVMAEFADAGYRNEFDAQAEAFLQAYVLAEGHKFEMIKFGSGVTLLDTDVFHAPEGSAYMMQWDMGDGKIFSLIGLRSEFQDFDLIA